MRTDYHHHGSSSVRMGNERGGCEVGGWWDFNNKKAVPERPIVHCTLQYYFKKEKNKTQTPQIKIKSNFRAYKTIQPARTLQLQSFVLISNPCPTAFFRVSVFF